MRRPIGLLAAAAAAVVCLAGCAAGVAPHPAPTSTQRAAIPTGAFVSIAPPATSYATLGVFGKYARALDTEYKVQPDFSDWDGSANQNCASVENGDTESMTEPGAFNGLPDDAAPDAAGRLIHPISGKVWAASLTARCPQVLTPALVKRFEEEQVTGLQWVRAQR